MAYPPNQIHKDTELTAKISKIEDPIIREVFYQLQNEINQVSNSLPLLASVSAMAHTSAVMTLTSKLK